MLKVQGVFKSFPGRSEPVLNQVSFDIETGETMALIGMSGVGKSTLGRILVGEESPDGGFVSVDELPMLGVSPYRRPVDMVEQQVSLLSHLTVAQNIALGAIKGLQLDSLSSAVFGQSHSNREQINQVVMEAASKAGVEPELLGRLANSTLSGGQRRRVDWARVLAARPQALVCDEVTTGLDPFKKDEVLKEVRRLSSELRCATLFITHDTALALSLSTTKVAILQLGGKMVVVSKGSLGEKTPGEAEQMLLETMAPG